MYIVYTFTQSFSKARQFQYLMLFSNQQISKTLSHFQPVICQSFSNGEHETRPGLYRTHDAVTIIQKIPANIPSGI